MYREQGGPDTSACFPYMYYVTSQPSAGQDIEGMGMQSVGFNQRRRVSGGPLSKLFFFCVSCVVMLSCFSLLGGV